MKNWREIAIDLIDQRIVTGYAMAIALLKYLNQAQVKEFLEINGLVSEEDNDEGDPGLDLEEK